MTNAYSVARLERELFRACACDYILDVVLAHFHNYVGHNVAQPYLFHCSLQLISG